MNYFKHYKLDLTNILSNFSYWVSPYICFPTFAENPIFWQIDCTHCLVGGVENLPAVKNHRSKVWILGKLWLHLDLSFQQNCIKVILVIAVEMALTSFLSKISSFHNHVSLMIFFVLQRNPAFKQFIIPKQSNFTKATSFGHRSWLIAFMQKLRWRM